MSDSGKTQLGKILLKRKLVSAKELDTILSEQSGAQGNGERLASKVLEKGLTDEVKLLTALSEQAGVPAVNLEDIQITLADLDILPREIAAQHVILPFSVSGESINLAMANPDDQRVIDEIEFVSGKKVFPHVALHGQIKKLVEVCYSAKENGETQYTGPAFGKSNTVQASRESIEPLSGTVIGETVRDSIPSANLTLDVNFEEPLDLDPQLSAAQMPRLSEPPIGDLQLEVQKKILVVDDEDDIRLLISRVLTEKGYEVITAGRGLEAIKMVQNENPDMIILDAMLPEVHGFDICKKIKGSKKYGHIPVIMISAIYRGWRYAQDLKDSYGVDDFIEKPFKLAEFIEKVEKYISEEPFGNGGEQEDLSQQTETILANSVQAYRNGDIEKAIELLKNGLQIDPLAYKLHYNLALLLGKKSLNYQAIRELENTLELAPEYFPAMKNLALLYQKAGFKFKAIETWERSLHYCPDDDTRDSIKQHLMNLL